MWGGDGVEAPLNHFWTLTGGTAGVLRRTAGEKKKKSAAAGLHLYFIIRQLVPLNGNTALYPFSYICILSQFEDY